MHGWRSLNDQLAALSLSPDEAREMDDFEASLSLKKNTVGTKLEKRRVSKIQKLLHSVAERPEGGTDVSRPKQK